MSDELKIKADSLTKVEKQGTNLWVEIDSRVTYTDIGAQHEDDLIKELRVRPWREVITDRYVQGSPWLYKIITDKGRSLFLDFLPVKKGGRFLDVGSGWGQIALPLARQGEVYCLDVTLPRLNILSEIARQEGAQLNYICGNYCTFPFEYNQFDLIIFNGSFEWIPIGDLSKNVWETQKDALIKTYNILNTGGIVYIGIENSLGLKYLLGAPDDHTAIKDFAFLNEHEASELYRKTFSKEYQRTKTWSLNEYKTMLIEAGLELIEIYGCIPDYKIIRQMIPLKDFNAFILEHGLFSQEHSGAEGAPLPFVDKMSPIYRLLAQNGIAQYFCPSFGIVARKPS